jgi:hypothetical protein
MAVILRIDVDRPYGKQGLVRHVASRIASDYILPRINSLGYLRELETILGLLNERGKSAYVFFRNCTWPSAKVRELMEKGGHQFGLHLENSRSIATFRQELHALEQELDRRITAFSKHGSGLMRLGRHHHPPYEPERYLPWAIEAGMKHFFGNLENPEILPAVKGTLTYYPSAFWLEPAWRDVKRFPINWLLHEATERDVVLLLHPDNVTADAGIMREFLQAIEQLDSVMSPI